METNGVNHHGSNEVSLIGVPMREAAEILGTTAEGIRHRIRRGSLRARKDGGRWLVMLPAAPATPAAARPATVHDDTAGQDAPASESAAPGQDNGHRVVAQLASTLVGQNTQLLDRIARLEQERFELAGRLGYLQSELEHAREQIKLLEAPKAESTPEVSTPVPPAPRPWWRFW